MTGPTKDVGGIAVAVGAVSAVGALGAAAGMNCWEPMQQIINGTQVLNYLTYFIYLSYRLPDVLHFVLRCITCCRTQSG